MSDLLKQMRDNPAGGWRMSDIERVCRLHGAGCEPPRGGGSHYKITLTDQSEILTIPFKRPIKPVYIRKLVAFLSTGD